MRTVPVDEPTDLPGEIEVAEHRAWKSRATDEFARDGGEKYRTILDDGLRATFDLIDLGALIRTPGHEIPTAALTTYATRGTASGGFAFGVLHRSNASSSAGFERGLVR